MVDFVLFNLCWMANAIGALYELFYLGPAVVLLSCAIHLTLVNGVGTEGAFLAITSVIGYGWDMLLFQGGILTFPLEPSAQYAPFWLLSQWVAFGLLFRHSIRWLRDQRALAILLGATGGPLSYYSATGFGIVALGDPLWQSLLAMAVGWSIIVPTFGKLSRHLEQLNF